MKTIVSLTFFDIAFDNRVKRTVNAVGTSDWKKIILYNSQYSSFADINDYDVQFINGKKTGSNTFHRFLSIQLFFLIQLFKLRPHIVFCNDIQPAPAVILYKLFFWLRAKVVYDAHEMEVMLYPKNMKAMGFLEKVLINVSSLQLTINTEIASFMKQQYNCNPVIIKNYPSLTEISNISETDFFESNSLTKTDKHILYTGVLLRNERGVEEVIAALSFLPTHYKFLISAVGELEIFKEYVYSLCPDLTIKNRVSFIGPYSEKDLLKIISFCDVSILLYNYRLNDNNNINTPNKLYQALLAGTHMLMCDNKSFKQIVIDTPVYLGETVDPSDVNAIADKIKAIVERTSFATEKEQIKNYGKIFLWESEFEKLKVLVKNL